MFCERNYLEELRAEEKNIKKMKVMIVISRFDKCGPIRELFSIVKEMRKESFIVYVLTLFTETKDSNIEEFKKLDINIKQANIPTNLKGWCVEKAIKEYEKECSPEIVYCCGLSACYHTAKVVRDKKIYCTLRNNAYYDLKSKFGDILGKFGEVLTDYYIKKVDYNICCSKTLQEVYQNRFKNKKIYCIQNGTDIQKFCVENKVDSVRKRKEDFHFGSKIIFLVSGSLDTRKDPITIIKAFKKLKLEKSAVLVFLGTGPLEKQCREMAENDNIIFVGFVNEVEKYYQIADVYISASRSEGLPNSVLEAGACGCRMILSDIPQHREIFSDNTDNVFYFQTGKDEALATLIQQNLRFTLLEEKEKMSGYIKDNFSDKKMGKKYCEFFQSTVSGVEQ